MAECIALACPRLRNTDPDNQELSIRVPQSDITKDKMSNTWCNHCQKQRTLMDYGHAHHWPSVRAQSLTHGGHYAIAGEYAAWFAAVAMGNQDSINALYAELIGNDDE